MRMKIVSKKESFQNLCCCYEELRRIKERLDYEISEISECFSVLSKRFKELMSPRVEISYLREVKESDLTGSVRRYLVVRKAQIVSLEARKFFVYRLERWISYDDEDDFSELDFIPLTAGEIIEERELDTEFIFTVKSLRRKVRNLTRQKKFLQKRLTEIDRRITQILIEVAKRIFGGDNFDEYEIDIARSYVEEALEKQVFDLQVLIKSKETSSDVKERLLDLIFGGVGVKKEERKEEEMKVYVKDFDMSYKIVPSERGGWIIRDNKVFMLIDKSFVPQAGIFFYKGRVKKIIIDKRGQEVPIIEIIGKF